jgi:hypothetical protein
MTPACPPIPASDAGGIVRGVIGFYGCKATAELMAKETANINPLR